MIHFNNLVTDFQLYASWWIASNTYFQSSSREICISRLGIGLKVHIFNWVDTKADYSGTGDSWAKFYKTLLQQLQ